MTEADARAHQARHGFLKGGDASCGNLKPRKSNGAATSNPKAAPKPRQNATEREYGLILEAMKRRGEISAYRFEGIKLAWGADPVTGRQMYYTPDFFIRDDFNEIVLVEVKGARIWPQDWIRFKGCRSEWPMFRFELHQRKDGQWTRLL